MIGITLLDSQLNDQFLTLHLEAMFEHFCASMFHCACKKDWVFLFLSSYQLSGLGASGSDRAFHVGCFAVHFIFGLKILCVVILDVQTLQVRSQYYDALSTEEFQKVLNGRTNQ